MEENKDWYSCPRSPPTPMYAFKWPESVTRKYSNRSLKSGPTPIRLIREPLESFSTTVARLMKCGQIQPSIESVKSVDNKLDAVATWLISGRNIERRLRALSLASQLPLDVLEELLFSDRCKRPEDLLLKWVDGSPIGHWQRWKILEKLSNAHIYIVTQSLSHSESALDHLSDLVEAPDKTVLPIFYGVEPSDVRHQIGTFAQAFAHYEIKYKDDPQKFKRWRAALTQLANLSGWDSRGWPEANLVQDVADKVHQILLSSCTRPSITHVPPKQTKPSRSSSGRRKHDVFLSFRGRDTRLNFTDHLYAALIRKRISTFKDDIDLWKGEDISTQLKQAIEGSKVCVVIVSPNYATSKWCLNELLQILEYRNASKVGMKKEMKTCPEEEQAHSLVNDGTHVHKASLQNMGNNISHNKRLGVNYGGRWVGSVYIGGRTDEIMVQEDITYNELIDQLYQIVGVDPNEDEIRIITIDDSKSPANSFVVISDDNDVKSFIDQNISSKLHLKRPLRKHSRL